MSEAKIENMQAAVCVAAPPKAKRQYCIAYTKHGDQLCWFDAVFHSVHEWIRDEMLDRMRNDPKHANIRTFEIPGDEA